MGDPEMVSRAERAAATLERAWERWRILHGLSAEAAPPVSSYVGYSIEEPWGRPRVVFGVDAREAELLAVLLDRHECVGPFYQPRQGRDGQVASHGGQFAAEADGLSHDGHCLAHDSQGLAHDDQGLAHDSQGRAHDDQGGMDHDGLGPGAAEHSSGPAAEVARAHFPAQAAPAWEREGQDVGLRAPAPLLPARGTERKTESAGQAAGSGENPRGCPDGHDFPAQAEEDHRDDGAGESTGTSDDRVSLSGAGADPPHRAEDQMDVADQDTARPDGTLAEPGDRRDESRDIHSAGPAGTGQSESADSDHETAGADPGIASGSPVGVSQNAAGPDEESAGVSWGGLAQPEGDYQPNMSIAAELAGWAAGELPGQASARLAEWAAMGRSPRRGTQPAGEPGVGAAGVGNR
jgi:hypothetical protein